MQREIFGLRHYCIQWALLSYTASLKAGGAEVAHPVAVSMLQPSIVQLATGV